MLITHLLLICFCFDGNPTKINVVMVICVKEERVNMKSWIKDLKIL